MATIFDRICTRMFGKSLSPNVQATQVAATNTTTKGKGKKSVRINEDINEVILIENVEVFIQNKNAEMRLRQKALKFREAMLSVEKKHFVPPVGTVLQAYSKRGHLLCAAVVLGDHRLMEIQRGNATGPQLYPRFIFNTPYEWQCWLNRL